MHARPDRALFNILAIVELEKRAWLAGHRAGKKDGYNNGLKEGIINHELYNEPVSDSRQEKPNTTKTQFVTVPACPKKEKVTK